MSNSGQGSKGWTVFTPVEGVEIYEIIRKRLFEELR